MAATKYYKFTDYDGAPLWGIQAFQYSFPEGGRPGAWLPHEDPVPCMRGYHAATARDLANWLIVGGKHRLFEVEFRGTLIEHAFKVCGESMRLLRELDPVPYYRWIMRDIPVRYREAFVRWLYRPFCDGVLDDDPGPSAMATEAFPRYVRQWAIRVHSKRASRLGVDQVRRAKSTRATSWGGQTLRPVLEPPDDVFVTLGE